MQVRKRREEAGKQKTEQFKKGKGYKGRGKEKKKKE